MTRDHWSHLRRCWLPIDNSDHPRSLPYHGWVIDEVARSAGISYGIVAIITTVSLCALSWLDVHNSQLQTNRCYRQGHDITPVCGLKAQLSACECEVSCRGSANTSVARLLLALPARPPSCESRLPQPYKTYAVQGAHNQCTFCSPAASAAWPDPRLLVIKISLTWRLMQSSTSGMRSDPRN